MFAVIFVAEEDHWGCLTLCCLKIIKFVYPTCNFGFSLIVAMLIFRQSLPKVTYLQIFWPLEVTIKASRGLGVHSRKDQV